jgi:hypothetical protein
METLDLKKIEKQPETAEMVQALAAETPQAEWVQLFSANGKHGSAIRRDPSDRLENE